MQPCVKDNLLGKHFYSKNTKISDAFLYKVKDV